MLTLRWFSGSLTVECLETGQNGADASNQRRFICLWLLLLSAHRASTTHGNFFWCDHRIICKQETHHRQRRGNTSKQCESVLLLASTLAEASATSFLPLDLLAESEG